MPLSSRKEDDPVWIRTHIYSVTSPDLSFSNCKNEDDGFLQLCANVQREHNTEWKAVSLLYNLWVAKGRKQGGPLVPTRQVGNDHFQRKKKKTLSTTYDPMTSLGFLIPRHQWDFGSILGTSLPCRELKSFNSQELLMVWEHPCTYRKFFGSSMDMLQSTPAIPRHFSRSQRCN